MRNEQAEPSIRDQCLATLRACRKADVLPMRYPVPAIVAEMLERMSLKSARTTVKAMLDLLNEIEK